MIKALRALMAAAFVLLGGGQVMAAAPLVDAAWVKANIGNPNVVFLDVRGNPRAYHAAHIPGAVWTSYGRDGWRVERDGVPGMLPPIDRLEKLIGRLGIDNASYVVLVPGGWNATEMGVGTRIYWTFKVLGHDKVSILDGGMTAYAADKRNPFERGAGTPAMKTFKADFRPELVASAADVKKAIKAGGAALLDHRPSDQYLGVNRSASTKRYGTLPGAVNVPATWATVDDGGNFRSPDVLRKLYGFAGASVDGDTINFCNTGHWASVGWFVSHELFGNEKARLYDGSVADWSRDPANPMAAGARGN